MLIVESTRSTDQALDLPDLPPRLRKKCIVALCKICGQQVLLPKSLQIPLCYNRSHYPLYCGGYADVWKGEYQGRSVAVKVLRVYSTSDFKEIASVSYERPLKHMYWLLILILQRFCKEVLTWKVLCHSNILPLLGVTMDNSRSLFAMASEWMVNGNINEFVNAHRDENRFELVGLYPHCQCLSC